jgi:hypothetical protein
MRECTCRPLHTLWRRHWQDDSAATAQHVRCSTGHCVGLWDTQLPVTSRYLRSRHEACTKYFLSCLKGKCVSLKLGSVMAARAAVAVAHEGKAADTTGGPSRHGPGTCGAYGLLLAAASRTRPARHQHWPGRVAAACGAAGRGAVNDDNDDGNNNDNDNDKQLPSCCAGVMYSRCMTACNSGCVRQQQDLCHTRHTTGSTHTLSAAKC